MASTSSSPRAKDALAVIRRGKQHHRCKWAEQQPRLLLKEIKAIPPAEGGRNAAYFLLDGFLETGGAFKYVLHKARRS